MLSRTTSAPLGEAFDGRKLAVCSIRVFQVATIVFDLTAFDRILNATKDGFVPFRHVLTGFCAVPGGDVLPALTPAVVDPVPPATSYGESERAAVHGRALFGGDVMAAARKQFDEVLEGVVRKALNKHGLIIVRRSEWLKLCADRDAALARLAAKKSRRLHLVGGEEP